MKRTASAHWEGNLKEGKGALTTQSGTLNNTQYNFTSRFEDGTGTNPEELIAAAHAGCFTMAFGAQLSNTGTPPESLDTIATVSLEMKDGVRSITSIHLEVTGKVSNCDAAKFQELATSAKETCIISRLLNTEITMTASLV